MLTDLYEKFMETTLEWLATHTAWGWKAQCTWWEHNFGHRHEQVRAKFIQDGCDVMSADQFNEWCNELRKSEFIQIMLVDRAEDEYADVVTAVTVEAEARILNL